jgi:hypothetical protein
VSAATPRGGAPIVRGNPQLPEEGRGRCTRQHDVQVANTVSRCRPFSSTEAYETTLFQETYMTAGNGCMVRLSSKPRCRLKVYVLIGCRSPSS